jgi:hypothetical protein
VSIIEAVGTAAVVVRFAAWDFGEERAWLDSNLWARTGTGE